ncbi:MAG: adenosylmethionine--8-amino-7-oxononanoate transaminase [Bacteroidetes bacterium]|mgnify:CR=1 FL=1|uniref:adenosylmethionine--8-amino-7-oxononanoate transaminase n=1 Tax=Flavobacterium filum TaxID=370974 RepID=UPI0023F1D955|nr:adenosylmethionine--8-amino-7-oxononanoate transaminase [Flavobacterium filum]MCA0429400.1 adenosylmethionine--8-amino-7-oxononanoate transaminase [Bacteroidota bacterium]
MNIVQKDNEFVWHPFTHQLNAKLPVNIIKGEGVYLIDENNTKYIDAISSWWVNIHGHCNPYISAKVSEQLNTLEHSIFSDFTHPNAVNLAERILKILPNNQNKIFYSDNGSTAVEVAIKMTLQYWHNQTIDKKLFIALENAYHGDTFGSMSVGARNVFNQAFENLLFNVAHIPLPTNENISDILEILQNWFNHHQVAGFIFEPLVQGAAGMIMYEAEHLDKIIELCKANHVITIADEVMTGFGRTGTYFASNQLTQQPDIICLSKGLTGGYMPLGVTSCTENIYNAYLSEDKTKTFFHGHSYTANPLACSAALASLDLLENNESKIQIKMIEKMHSDFVLNFNQNTKTRTIRYKGTILAIELNTTETTHYLNAIAESINTWFLKKGIIVRPLGNILYIIPPYCIKKEELNYIYEQLKLFINELPN